MLGEGIVSSWVSLSGVFGQSLNEEGVKGVFSRLRLGGESEHRLCYLPLLKVSCEKKVVHWHSVL